MSQAARAAFWAALALSACAPHTAAPGTPASSPPPAATGAVPALAPPAAVGEMLADISADRLRETVDRLAGFGTRHTLSDTASDTRGIGAARRYLHGELARAAEGTSLQVSFDAHRQPADGRRLLQETEIVNVMAVLPGRMTEARDRRYYVIGHYDSRASEVMDAVSDAPGANDDGSGTALVVELARVMAHRPYDATLVFLATAGEEQGLYGAALHAAAAREQGWEVRGVLSNDIVGDPTAPSGAVYAGAVRVFSEAVPEEPGAEELARLRTLSAWNDSPSRQLARFVHQVARWHRLPVEPRLVLRTDRFLRGGDHTAFNRHGFPAVRFTEVEEDYDRQHQDVRREGGVQYGDLPEFVDASYLAEVARVNAAALAHLANAPSAPQQVRILIRGLGHETRLRWEPSPEPDLAGYEVVWRDTASALWEHARDVGAVTEATLPVSKDNFFFGVRAYDRDGYRSPVTFAAAGRE